MPDPCTLLAVGIDPAPARRAALLAGRDDDRGAAPGCDACVDLAPDAGCALQRLRGSAYDLVVVGARGRIGGGFDGGPPWAGFARKLGRAKPWQRWALLGTACEADERLARALGAAAVLPDDGPDAWADALKLAVHLRARATVAAGAGRGRNEPTVPRHASR